MTQHTVRLFDTPASLADSLSSFVGEGLARGETVLVVIRPEHWALTLDRLGTRGWTVSRAVALGQLMVLDAADTLTACMAGGRPDGTAFDNSVGDLVRRLATGTTLRIYGEMVDLLAAKGDFRSAIALEELWNGLARQCSYSLLCGYAAVHFGNPRSTGALDLICRLHGLATTASGDDLSDFLVRKAADQTCKPGARPFSR
jgi:hypothetical protein